MISVGRRSREQIDAAKNCKGFGRSWVVLSQCLAFLRTKEWCSLFHSLFSNNKSIREATIRKTHFSGALLSIKTENASETTFQTPKPIIDASGLYVVGSPTKPLNKYATNGKWLLHGSQKDYPFCGQSISRWTIAYKPGYWLFCVPICVK